MNHTEQKIYRRIVSAQFEHPRPFQRRMLAIMVIAICRRAQSTEVFLPHNEWGDEAATILVSPSVGIVVSAYPGGRWSVWHSYRRNIGGRHKQRMKGIRAAVEWLREETHKPDGVTGNAKTVLQ